jgi:hypothetical protein
LEDFSRGGFGDKVGMEGVFWRVQQRRFKVTTKIKGAFKKSLTKEGKGGK